MRRGSNDINLRYLFIRDEKEKEGRGWKEQRKRKRRRKGMKEERETEKEEEEGGGEERVTVMDMAFYFSISRKYTRYLLPSHSSATNTSQVI